MIEAYQSQNTEKAQFSDSNLTAGTIIEDAMDFSCGKLSNPSELAGNEKTENCLPKIDQLEALDYMSQVFSNDLDKAIYKNSIDDKFKTDMIEIGKRCLEDPEFREEIELLARMKGLGVSFDRDGISFSRSIGDYNPNPMFCRNSYQVKIPFDGSPAKGYWIQQAGCKPPVRREIDAEEAISYVFAEQTRRVYPRF